MNSRLSRRRFQKKFFSIICVIAVLSVSLSCLRPLLPKAFKSESLRKTLGKELFSKNFINNDIGDLNLAGSYTKDLSSLVEQFAFYRSKDIVDPNITEASELILVAMVENKTERNTLNSRFIDLMDKRNMDNVSSKDTALLNIKEYVIFYDVKDSAYVLDPLSKFFKTDDIGKYEFSPNNNGFKRSHDGLFEGLMSLGYQNNEIADNILVKPYVYKLENIEDYYAAYIPRANELVGSENFVYVVKSDDKGDREFTLDGFKRVMGTAVFNEENHVDASILEIGDYVLYYQTDDETPIVNLLKQFFNIDDTNQYVIANYKDKFNVIKNIMEEMIQADVQLGDKNKRFVFGRGGKVLSTNHLDANKNLLHRFALYALFNADKKIVMCLDPIHATAPDSDIIYGDSKYIALEELSILRDHPEIARNIERYAMAGMAWLYRGNYLPLDPTFENINLYDEVGLRYFAAMAELIYSEMIKTGLYNGTGIADVKISLTTIPDTPDDEIVSVMFDVENEKQDLLNFLRQIESAPANGVYKHDDIIRQGERITYKTDVPGYMVELIDGNLEFFDVDIQDDQIVFIAKRDVPLNEVYQFSFRKTLNNIPNIDRILFSSDKHGAISEVGNTQFVGVLGMPRSRMPSFTFTITSEGNIPRLGNVVLQKVDADNIAKLLAGARFSLYKRGNPDVLIKSASGQDYFVTDSQGEIRVNDLEYGEYYFRELEAPEGYNIVPGQNLGFAVNEQTPAGGVKVVAENKEEPPLPPEPEKPENPEIHKEVSEAGINDNWGNHLNLNGRYDTHYWNIQTSFGENTSTWDTVRIDDTFVDILEIDQAGIRVVDKNGNDIRGRGTLTVVGQRVMFELLKEGGNFRYLENEVYTITVPTKIKDGVTDEMLANYIVQNPLHPSESGVPNEAELVVNNNPGRYVSEKPTVIPPKEELPPPEPEPELPPEPEPELPPGPEKPENPGIHKEVSEAGINGNWGNHLTLKGRYDTHYWNIQTSFGENTSTWETVMIEDTFADILEIDQAGIRVVDKNGNDVRGKGTLTVVGQRVMFDLLKEGGNFKYLENEVYTITVPTKIKAGVTDEMLANYIVQNPLHPSESGVPNEAELVVNNNPGRYISEKPTVIPPKEELPPEPEPELPPEPEPELPPEPEKPENPEIHKEVSEDGEINADWGNHLNLKGRYDTHYWNIETSFGENTSTWNTVLIDDIFLSIFEIDRAGITIVDKNGNDVSGKGTLNIYGQRIMFELSKEGGTFKYLENEVYTITVPTKIKADVTDEMLAVHIVRNQLHPSESGIPNRAELNINTNPGRYVSEKPTVVPPGELPPPPPEPEPELPPEPEKPENPEIHKEVSGDVGINGNWGNHLNLKGRYDTHYWNIVTGFGENTSKWETVRIEDTFVDILEIDQAGIRVVNKNGNDVKGKGTLTVVGQKVVFELSKEGGNFKYLENEVYTITVPTKIKAGVTDEMLANYIVRNPLHPSESGVPNEAELVVNNNPGKYVSEKPTVVPPGEELPPPPEPEPELPPEPEKPENPEIHKEVGEDREINADWGNHLTLKGRYDTHYWNIQTSFGENTSTWETVMIEDTFADILEIDEAGIIIVDKKGNDVGDKGTLKVIGQKVIFVPDKSTGSFSYLENEVYTIIVPTKIKDGVTDEMLADYIVRNPLHPSESGVPNEAQLVINNNPGIYVSEKPTVVPPEEELPPPLPENPEIHKEASEDGEINGEWGNHLTLKGRYDTHYWNIETSFGENTSTWETVRIEDTFVNILEIDEAGITVVDRDGNDASDKGTITVDGQRIVFELSKEAGNFSYLENEIYTLTVPTKIKAGVTNEELAGYLVRNPLHPDEAGIPNEAELVVNNNPGRYVSEKPTVVPPNPPLPENPEIHKEASEDEGINGEWGNHLTLKGRYDTHYWNIETSFGENTSTWGTVRIEDTFVDILEIDEAGITVVDRDGNDVGDKGTITVDGQKVVFELSKEGGGFSYLENEIYTITVPTKIKDGVTDEELAGYLVRNPLHPDESGIPNEAELVVNNNPGKYVSEKPTVVPPNPPLPENPEIHKEASEGEEINGDWGNHLTLKDRYDTHYWNIETIFGENTSTWETVRIEDTFVDILEIDEAGMTVIDKAGNDVSDKGTITVDGQKVVFELSKEGGDFSYLENEVYTITVPTRIKANVTDEELANYIVRNPLHPNESGVPNEAELVVNNNPGKYVSEKPTVVPPKPVEPPPTEPQTGDYSSRLLLFSMAAIVIMGATLWGIRKRH